MPPTVADEFELIPFSELESRRELWSRLATSSGNVFATWEWADAWWRRFGSATEPAFFECRDKDGRPFAILPLCAQKRGPIKLLRFMGHRVGDVLGPICDPADAALAGAALRRAAAAIGGSALLLAERLPGGPMPAGLGGRLLIEESSPYLEVEGRDWDTYLGTRSKNLREKVRRGTRKLERAHTIEWRLCEDADRVEDDMRSLISLHRRRWSEGSNFGRAEIAGFHLGLAPVLFERGWLRLWTLAIDGEPAAAWYGFRFGATESFFQSGREPAFDNFSVGFLMLVRTIRAAFDDGLERYAFLRGDEPYKDRFADRDEGLESRVYGRGPLGAPAMAGASLAARSTRIRGLAAAALSKRGGATGGAGPAPGA